MGVLPVCRTLSNRFEICATLATMKGVLFGHGTDITGGGQLTPPTPPPVRAVLHDSEGLAHQGARAADHPPDRSHPNMITKGMSEWLS